MSSLFERVASRARARYWRERHDLQGCTDPFPSEQVESLMAVLCEEVESLVQYRIDDAVDYVRRDMNEAFEVHERWS